MYNETTEILCKTSPGNGKMRFDVDTLICRSLLAIQCNCSYKIHILVAIES